MIGNHVVKTWSNTQAIIALSSGEAEFYGAVKAGSIGLGLKSIMKDMGIECKLKLKVKTDSSAAKGIASRKGLGEVRHIEVHQLWIQDKVASGEIEMVKVPGNENIADALTKNVESEKLMWHMNAINLRIDAGRHELMPEISMSED